MATPVDMEGKEPEVDTKPRSNEKIRSLFIFSSSFSGSGGREIGGRSGVDTKRVPEFEDGEARGLHVERLGGGDQRRRKFRHGRDGREFLERC